MPATDLRLFLSAEVNRSVILAGGSMTYTLTVDADGDAPVDVDLTQALNPGGRSTVLFGGLGGPGTAAVRVTTGGPDNTATVTLRGATAGAYEGDFRFEASVGGVLAATTTATVVTVLITPNCVILPDDRAAVQTAQLSLPIAGFQLTSDSVVAVPDFNSPTTLLASPQFSPTDASGAASRTFTSLLALNLPYIIDNVSATGGTGSAATPDTAPSGGTGKKGEEVGPDPGSAVDSSNCGVPDSDSPRSVDPTDGQLKIASTDLFIPGRGEVDFGFRRVYRSGHQGFRDALGLNDFGVGWTFSYADDRLLKDGTGPVDRSTYLHLTTHQVANVYVNTVPGAWATSGKNFAQLTRDPLTGDFEIREPDGLVRVYHGFDDPGGPAGRPKEVRDRNGNRMTFRYERIDPDAAVGGDEKFVLAYAVDALGREVRYQYYARADQVVNGRAVAVASPNPGAWGRLARVVDFKGDMDFDGNAESADFAGQVNNRALTFDYDAEGNLVRVSSPAVAGTPTGNDFAAGTTVRYGYLTRADLPAGLTPAQQARLLGKLTHVWNPNEVRDAAGADPADDQAVEVITYQTDPADPFFGFAVRHEVGGANGTGVASGGAITYAYTDLNPTGEVPPGYPANPAVVFDTPFLKTELTDRNGFRSEYVYGGGATLLSRREFTAGLRQGEPEEFLVQGRHNGDRLLKRVVREEGNATEFTYDTASPDRFQRTNVVRVTQLPDADRGGEQAKIETVYVHEPIYNRVSLAVFPRGADAAADGFTPPVADPAARTMRDPYDPSRTLDLRYARVTYFDYQESRELARQAPDGRLDRDGRGRVNQSALVAVDPDVLTTEVLLVRELGLSEDAAGLAELRARLARNLIRLGLGDLNGDGDTTPTAAGNEVRVAWGSPVLLEGSNQHALEQLIDPVDLVNQGLGYIDGGTAEGASGGRLQTVVTMFQYDRFGQMTRTISPEGNVTDFRYYAESDPDGDGVGTPAPADGRALAGDTGGYLRETRADTTRNYFDQSGAASSGAFSNNNTNPVATAITTTHRYDDVGNVVSTTDGRGIRTDFFVTEHNRVVQTTWAADISGVTAADPSDPLFGLADPDQRLTAFGYLSRTYFDYNGNVVLTQMEDRGNTSGVDGLGVGALPAHALATTPGLAAADPPGAGTGDPPALPGGGFENPAVGPGAFQYAPAGGPWVFSPSAGVSGNGSGFTGGNPDAPEGTQVLFLQDGGSATTSLTLAAGTYTVTLRAAQRGNVQPGGPQTVEVVVDGAVVGRVTPSGTEYQSFTVTFTVGDGPHTLTLQGTGTQDSTAFVDDVRLAGSGGGGRAFVDTLYLYDRLDNRVEMRVEVDGSRSLNTRYRYDGSENLVLTIHPEGNADAAVYDERDLLFQSTRGAAVRPTAGRYAADDPTTFDRPGGAGTVPSTTTYNYDFNKNLTEVVDAEFNGGARSAIAGVGDVTRYTYDGYDRRKTVTDALGNKTTYVYDPASNVVRVIQDGAPVFDDPGSSGDVTLAVTEYVHDELSRVIATHRVLFRTPGTDPARPPTLTDTPAMDALAAYLADASTDLAAVPGATGVTVLGRIATLTEYDRESRVTFTVTDDLDVSRTDYDGASRTVRTTDSVLSNGFAGGAFDPALLAGNTVEMAYDDNGNRIEVRETDVATRPGVASEVFRTTYLYDSLDRLQTMVDNVGQATDYRYDSRGNLVATADAVGPLTGRTVRRRGLGSDAAVAVNDFGNVTRRFYDGVGRLLQTEALLTPSGQGNGTYIGATLEGVKVDPPAGYLDPGQSEDGIIRVDYAYDDNSNLLALRDDDGNTTGYVYDNQDRRLVERKGLNAGYQGTAFAVAGGDAGAFRAERLPPELRDPPVDTEPAGTDVVYTYDLDSNVVRMVDEAGNVFDCTFDALNRKVGCDVAPAAGFVGTTLQQFRYDGLSRLTGTFDNNEPGTDADDVAVRYFYDSLSRKVEEQQRIGPDLPGAAKAISTSFDVAASRAVWMPSSLAYPDGRVVTSTYDALDRLVARRDAGQATDVARYEYIGGGRVLTLSYQNGTRLVRGYDGDRRVTTHRWETFADGTPPGGGTLVVGFGYVYDRADNKLVEEKLHDPDNSEVYAYDSTYRLKTFARGTLTADRTAVGTPTTTAGALQAQTWELDGLGNWTANTHTTGGVTGTEGRTHSDFNEIADVTGDPYADGVAGAQAYDRNGNLTDDGVRLYQWDALNRLRRVFRKADGALVAEYTYDTQNRRMRKVVTSGGVDGTAADGRTDFFYDGWRVVEERDGGDGLRSSTCTATTWTRC